MTGGVSCVSHAKLIRASSRGIDDWCPLCTHINSFLKMTVSAAPTQSVWLRCEMTSDGSCGCLFWIFFPAFAMIVLKQGSSRAERSKKNRLSDTGCHQDQHTTAESVTCWKESLATCVGDLCRRLSRQLATELATSRRPVDDQVGNSVGDSVVTSSFRERNYSYIRTYCT